VLDGVSSQLRQICGGDPPLLSKMALVETPADGWSVSNSVGRLWVH